MRKAILVIAGLGLVALALPTVQAGVNDGGGTDLPSTPGTYCASVDRDTTTGEPNANVEHPDDTDDRMHVHVEAVVAHEDEAGERVAIGVDAGGCIPS